MFSEPVVGCFRNGWSDVSGIGGRMFPEYAFLEVDLARLAAELIVVTIITFVLYMTLGDSKSD